MLTAVLLLNDKKRFISHGNDVVHAYLLAHLGRLPA